MGTAFPGGRMVKNPPANAGATGDGNSILVLRRSHGGGNGNPLQYSCLEHSMDRGIWWATDPGLTKSHILLSDCTSRTLSTHRNW